MPFCSRRFERRVIYRKLWQSFAVLLPIKSVGVMGDQRTYENIVAVRAVTSKDAMTADWARLPHKLLGSISNRIINEVKGVNRVVYDISSKAAQHHRMGIGNMEENDPSRFRMRLDDDNEERPARKGEDADGRIQVLGKRINRMAVLLPVFVVLVLVLAYLDLEKRVIRSHDTGSNKVQSLSEDLEDRFSSLSVRQAKLEEAHQQLTAQTNTLADAFRKDLETVASLVAQAGEKIGKTQSEVARLSTAIQAVDRRLDPVIKDQKAVADKLGRPGRQIQSGDHPVQRFPGGSERTAGRSRQAGGSRTGTGSRKWKRDLRACPGQTSAGPNSRPSWRRKRRSIGR